MPLKLDIQKGGEYLLPFAKRKLAQLKSLKSEALQTLNKTFAVNTGERVSIHSTAVYDLIRITKKASDFLFSVVTVNAEFTAFDSVRLFSPAGPVVSLPVEDVVDRGLRLHRTTDSTAYTLAFSPVASPYLIYNGKRGLSRLPPDIQFVAAGPIEGAITYFYSELNADTGKTELKCLTTGGDTALLDEDFGAYSLDTFTPEFYSTHDRAFLVLTDTITHPQGNGGKSRVIIYGSDGGKQDFGEPSPPVYFTFDLGGLVMTKGKLFYARIESTTLDNSDPVPVIYSSDGARIVVSIGAFADVLPFAFSYTFGSFATATEDRAIFSLFADAADIAFGEYMGHLVFDSTGQVLLNEQKLDDNLRQSLPLPINLVATRDSWAILALRELSVDESPDVQFVYQYYVLRPGLPDIVSGLTSGSNEEIFFHLADDSGFFLSIDNIVSGALFSTYTPVVRLLPIDGSEIITPIPDLNFAPFRNFSVYSQISFNPPNYIGTRDNPLAFLNRGSVLGSTGEVRVYDGQGNIGTLTLTDELILADFISTTSHAYALLISQDTSDTGSETTYSLFVFGTVGLQNTRLPLGVYPRQHRREIYEFEGKVYIIIYPESFSIEAADILVFDVQAELANLALPEGQRAPLNPRRFTMERFALGSGASIPYFHVLKKLYGWYQDETG